MGELGTGLDKAKTGVNEAVNKAEEKLTKLNGLDQYVKAPVDIKEHKVSTVADYGSAFTPYFASLSLWVGALMMFFAIYLDPDVRFRREKRNSKGIVTFLAYTVIGLVQSVVLTFVLLKTLNLQVSNVPLFYGVMMLISLAFVSIMRLLLVHIGASGKFVAILLLILQLTACGGTFPMELVPDFFKVINPYMPMTYSVNAMREVISGVDTGFFMKNIWVLIGITVGFFAINMVIYGIKLGMFKKKEEEDDNFSDAEFAG